MLTKIVIIGPESTGKSTLCQQLATHFATRWVPEYARNYLLQNGNTYTYEDLLTIAQGQLALEDEITAQTLLAPPPPGNTRHSHYSPLLFIDTDMYVMKVWCEFVFGKCHSYIEQQIAARTYDFYLLCNTDLPWVKDELREYPDLPTRERLYDIYKNMLQQQHTPWAIITGTQHQRLKTAIETINHHFGRL